MLDKSKTYYENANTHEICDDPWQADFWAETGNDVVYWYWSDVCECWLDRMVRIAY